MRRNPQWPGGALLHPLPLLAAAVIAFNDFYLKRSDPGLLSGKLSDFGLMFFFPVMIFSALEWVFYVARKFGARIEIRPRWLPVTACALGAAYFSAIKLFATGATLHVDLLETLVPSRRFAAVADPTDLVALVMVPLAWIFLRREAKASQEIG